MALISVTRLRLRSWLYFPAFAIYTARSSRQAQTSPGNLGVRLLKDKSRTFWTCTAWADEAAMKAFMTASPHFEAMKKLPRWCSEAAFVHWIQSEPTFPNWQEAYQRLKREGRRSKVLYPSKAHDAGEFPPPRG
jgi:heme-degrading monooxygenase HmoA